MNNDTFIITVRLHHTFFYSDNIFCSQFFKRHLKIVAEMWNHFLSFVWEHLDDTLQFSNHTKFYLGSCYFILAIFILFSERYIVEGTCKYLVTILYSYVQFQIMIFFSKIFAAMT